ncbi:MAG: DUF2784 domain-containing protein [Balneolaceae bacterium]
MYQAADIFFIVFHSSIILFNLFGWIWKTTRKWNLALLVLTGLSWTVLGIWYGFGYCPCTDWHWDVLQELGRPPATPSYIEYLVERLTPLEISNRTADIATVISYIFLLIISGYLNWRDWRRK